MNRQFSIPVAFEASIEKALATYNLSLADSKNLAKAVLQLSDYFIQHPQENTPWNDKWAQIAYLCYYLPLNGARFSAVITEAQKQGFFAGLENVVDFGAGLATASMTLAQTENFHFDLIESSGIPQQLIEKFFPHFKPRQWSQSLLAKSISAPEKTMAVFSYSLTELSQLPDWALNCEALMIVEPSTQQDGRRLMALRQKLIEKGYSLWAPCTHQQACPLLTQSKTDWCHDRIHFAAPEWFMKLEEHLPMKNRTLTFSYLLARKKAAPLQQTQEKTTVARIVSDQLKEKGKDRQMVCRGPDREFLSWLHKHGLEQEIPRGSLVELPQDLVKVSNELRLSAELKII